MKALTKVAPILVVGIFLTSLLIVPSVFVFGGSNALSNIDGPFESQALLSQIPHDARVAIYDEDNLTSPVYSTAVNLTNNLNEITTLLEDAGHSVEALTEEDILNHELLTADYDVFIIVNNVPRPTIINHVKEFWLGGGGLLTFNNAQSYLWFAGILDPTSTDDEYSDNWLYFESDTQNVSARHPTMREHHINDTISERAHSWLTTSTAVLEALDFYPKPTVLLSNVTLPFFVTAFAVEGARGGRIVHLPGDGSSIPADFESIITDSVEWLKPKPKGRIVFDLSHSARIGIDPWDEEFITVWTSVNSFTQFRTLAANHSYTFDKLYPSASGNLTAARLAKYDLLVINWPDLDYTAAERAAVEAWVDGGGSLLALGDRTGMSGGGPGDTYINQLLQNFDMSLGTTDDVVFESMTPGTHVTLEGCTSLYIGPHNYLSVIGNATELWFDGTDAVVACEEFGDGRAILSADMNIFDNSELGEQSNVRFALNALNWLTAADADILAFESFNDDMLAALRDMGLSYQPSYSNDYIIDFLDSKEWGLVVIDQANFFFDTAELDALYAYVNGGGKLIMSYFDIDDDDTHPLWSLLGVEHAGEPGDFPNLYIWDTDHPIFTEPHDRSAVNYTTPQIFGDDGDKLTVLEGFTALAGSSAAVQDGNAYIVLKDDYQTLYNGFLISGAYSDEDDSTYRDSIELWQNEIAFMLDPPSPGGLPFNLDPTTLLIIGAGVLGVVVIGAVAMRKRGSGSSKPKKRSTKKKK